MTYKLDPADPFSHAPKPLRLQRLLWQSSGIGDWLANRLEEALQRPGWGNDTQQLARFGADITKAMYHPRWHMDHRAGFGMQAAIRATKFIPSPQNVVGFILGSMAMRRYPTLEWGDQLEDTDPSVWATDLEGYELPQEPQIHALVRRHVYLVQRVCLHHIHLPSTKSNEVFGHDRTLPGIAIPNSRTESALERRPSITAKIARPPSLAIDMVALSMPDRNRPIESQLGQN